MKLEDVRFDDRGLAPAIVQDARTREVLTLAYMNEESLRRTMETGETWFWSRSREQLWHKGETSGHTQRVVSISLDCDCDALTIQAVPRGPACHKGNQSCFEDVIYETSSVSDKPMVGRSTSVGDALDDLYSIIESRNLERPEGSYTTYLFDHGLDKILKKFGEEASETIIAAKNDDHEALTREISDLLFHLFVLLVERKVTLEEITEELMSRRKTSKK
jgi:phosphoribosyl-AMP cyclohydrolase / phosphoribosyl-ATP pyrophosphohydrolase